MLSQKSATIQADLVRSLAIADQFPDRGYQDRQVDVYRRSLELQRKWLLSQGTVPAEFNPLESSDDDIILALLTEPYYYTDTGFADWQNVIAKFSMDEVTKTERLQLRQLSPDAGHFISVRQRFAPILHQQALQHLGADYLSWTDDKRAEVTAMALLGISLYAQGG